MRSPSPHKGDHMLPIKKSVQDAIGKHAGDSVTIHLTASPA